MSELLRINALRLSRGDREILGGVALSVETGQITALMGLSGSGKTTILRAAVALEPFQDGRIEVGDFALTAGPLPPQSHLKPLRRKIGMVFQAHALFEHLSVLENILLAPIHVLRRARREAEPRALELLDSLGVGSRAHAYPRALSGGEAQRAAIARALAVDPPLLLLDEPTASLDPARRGSLGDILMRLAREERGLLLTTHDTDFAADFADRVVILADGRVVEEGTPSDVLSNPTHPATRDLLAHRSPDRP